MDLVGLPNFAAYGPGLLLLMETGVQKKGGSMHIPLKTQA